MSNKKTLPQNKNSTKKKASKITLPKAIEQTGDWDKVQKNIDVFDLGYECGFRDGLHSKSINKGS